MRRCGSAERNGAVLYCRVSTKEQVQNLSLAVQERECRRYCADQGLDVLEVFVEEGESAKTANRPKLKRMLEFCRKNRDRLRHVVVYRIDRFSRSTHDQTALKAFLVSLDITLRSVMEPIDESPIGNFMENVIASIAQLDNEVRRERTIAGMEAALAEGRWILAEPLGYRRVADAAGRRTIEPDPQTAPLVRRAFELFATGRYSQKEVRQKLTALGLRSRQNRRLSSEALRNILRNRLYKGAMCVQSWGMVDVTGDFEPVVDADTFDAVQAILDGRGLPKVEHHLSHPEFPLRRFVRCGDCGSLFTGSKSKGRTARYAYYSCRGKGCGRRIPNGTLEAEFMDYLRRLCPRPGYMRLFREVVLDAWKSRQADLRGEAKALGRRLERLEDQRRKLVHAHVFKETISDEIFREEEARLSQEITFAKIELRAARIDDMDVTAVLEFAEVLVTNAAHLWEEASLDQRLRLQDALFPKGVTHSTSSGFGTAESSLFFEWLRDNSARDSGEVSPTGFEPVLPA